MFSAPILMLRALGFGMIMLKRRTVLITLSTFLRLLSLGVSLIVLPYWLHGAAVGAAALVICMSVESIFAFTVSLRYFRELPAGEGPQPTYWEMWRFSWPVILNQTSESGIAVVINIFLGRLTSPDLALASFGVVHSLASLILGPIRNLVQTAQTMVRTSHDMRILFRFTNYLVIFFSMLVMGLFFSPARHWVLKVVMGLTDELAAYSEPAVMATFLVIVFWGYAALFRGLLAGERKTLTFAISASGRMLTVVGLGGATLMLDNPNGAVFGVVAWGAAYCAESLILGWRLFFSLPGAEPVYNIYSARARKGRQG
jgi:Na+-driven multidrug efflux pump